MRALYGIDHAVRNVYRVARPYGDERIRDLGALRLAFLNFLENGQFYIPPNRECDPFITDPAREALLARAYAGSNLDDLGQESVIGPAYSDGVRMVKVQAARGALYDLFSRSAEFQQLFELHIHSIFVRDTNRLANGSSAHGGSTSGAIGSIWLSIDDSVSHADLMELLVHETTHHMIFVDELNHAQFDYDAISRPENYAMSAIRGMRRPLDKVVHSVVVGAEILAARREFLTEIRPTSIHPDSEILAPQIQSAIDSVSELPAFHRLVTPHVEDMMERSAQIVARSGARTTPVGA